MHFQLKFDRIPNFLDFMAQVQWIWPQVLQNRLFVWLHKGDRQTCIMGHVILESLAIMNINTNSITTSWCFYFFGGFFVASWSAVARRCHFNVNDVDIAGFCWVTGYCLIGHQKQDGLAYIDLVVCFLRSGTPQHPTNSFLMPVMCGARVLMKASVPWMC